jgi:hypothetical protein
MYRLIGAPEWVYCLIAASFGLVFVGLGVFAVLGGLSNRDAFRNRRKTQFVIWLLGRTGPRVYSALVGVALIAFGSYFVVGAIWKLISSWLLST